MISSTQFDFKTKNMVQFKVVIIRVMVQQTH